MNRCNIVIFGTGKVATRLLAFEKKSGVEILCFLDNDDNKHGREWHGYCVFSPDYIQNLEYDYILIACLNGIDEIIHQLIRLGVSQDRIVIPSWENLEYEGGFIDALFCIPKYSFKNEIKKLNIKLDYIREALGRIEGRQIIQDSSVIGNAEFKVYSQWGEDGIIKWLTSNIDIHRKIFVEFGVSNYDESNTRFLLIDQNWSGLVMDGSDDNIKYIRNDEFYWRYNIKAERAFITAENIDQILVNNGITGEIGLLSIDIDGNDYWVWKNITVINPAIVICEYNHRFGKDRAVTIPYNPDFSRREAHYSQLYFGASLRAIDKLAHSKGYSLVTINSNANNAFFVKNELLNERVKSVEIDDIFIEGKFREARDEDGNLSFMDVESEIKLLNGMPVVEV